VVGIDRKQAGFILAFIIILLVALWSASVLFHAASPVRIGVLLPVSANSDLKEPLEWAKENINREGGINGRPIELVYRDTSHGNIQKPARELLDDHTIQVVIGPYSTDEVFKIAPMFIEKKKILISPSACGGDVIRAFGKTGYFWRTMQGDVEQVRAMTGILREQKVRRIALLVENSTNGDTFYRWTGFFATESGLNLTYIRQFEPGERGLEERVRGALATGPEVVIVLAAPNDTARVWRAMQQEQTLAKLFVADFSDSAPLIRQLGGQADGILGIQVASDPSTGFSVAFDEKFHHAPDGYAAPAYDAVLLAAYTAARQDAAWFESPADSIRAVVYGNGTGYNWDAQGVRQTLRAIRAGQRPEIWGASGPLDYDREYGVDPLIAYYGYGVVEEGAFRVSHHQFGKDRRDTAGGCLRCPVPGITIADGTPWRRAGTLHATRQQDRLLRRGCRALERLVELPAPVGCPCRVHAPEEEWRPR
jgi:ABC-type branched-subunit amino acid transport system substrate-binding protein